MTATDATGDLPPQPAPQEDERSKPIPPHIANFLHVLHVLLIYGRHLTLTLERRREMRGFSSVAQFFGTARLPVIFARLARGMLRIQALQRVLLDRARRGRDLVYLKSRKYRPHPEKPAQPQAPDSDAGQQTRRTPVRRRDPDAVPDPDNLPTLAQLEAEIRRKGPGHALEDICHDLGVAPELCCRWFAVAVLDIVRWYRGDQQRFLTRFYHRKSAIDPELNPTPPMRLPERSWDAIKRMLGFTIGEHWPVLPVFAPATPIAHETIATRPP